MTAERREAASPNLVGGAENPATVCQHATDFTSDPAAGRTAVPAPFGPAPAASGPTGARAASSDRRARSTARPIQ
jgi:hypothetical protein